MLEMEGGMEKTALNFVSLNFCQGQNLHCYLDFASCDFVWLKLDSAFCWWK